MRKIFSVICIAILAIAAISCNKEEKDANENEKDCIKKILKKYEDKFVDLNGENLYLYIKEEGEGDLSLNETIKITYNGTALQKSSTFAKKDVVEYTIDQFIPGWRIALESNKIKHQSQGALLVPYKFAYKDKQVGVIEPYSTLFFEFYVE